MKKKYQIWLILTEVEEKEHGDNVAEVETCLIQDDIENEVDGRDAFVKFQDAIFDEPENEEEMDAVRELKNFFGDENSE